MDEQLQLGATQMFEYLRSDISRVEGKIDKLTDLLTTHTKEDTDHFQEINDRLTSIEVTRQTLDGVKERNWVHRAGWGGAAIALLAALLAWFHR